VLLLALSKPHSMAEGFTRMNTDEANASLARSALIPIRAIPLLIRVHPGPVFSVFGLSLH